MQFRFKTFNVGAGDCITLLLKSNDKEMHIMVDCGNYTKEVDDFITHVFCNHIDYLIVTHIDNDHINGLIQMLSSKPELVINHILYNCYQRTSDELEKWDDKMIENVNRVYGHLPVVVDMLEGKINANASKTLAELILGNENWKNAWGRDYITVDSPNIDLEDAMGRIVFLSPTKEALDVLDKEYRLLFWKKLYKPKRFDYDKEETIYEALMRIMEAEPSESSEEAASQKVLDEKALSSYADEKMGALSPANKASIAFVWEHEDHRILFMGDAAPNQVAEKLNDVYKNITKPVLFDAIKVSHHGSAHSMSKELIGIADSELYFVTGGANVRPSYQALARIIMDPLCEGISHREIRYNRENGILMDFDNQVALKTKYHYFIIGNANGYEISY